MGKARRRKKIDLTQLTDAIAMIEVASTAMKTVTEIVSLLA